MWIEIIELTGTRILSRTRSSERILRDVRRSHDQIGRNVVQNCTVRDQMRMGITT
jgi:hypothetical protein